jgi:hypothetical protein
VSVCVLCEWTCMQRVAVCSSWCAVARRSRVGRWASRTGTLEHASAFVGFGSPIRVHVPFLSRLLALLRVIDLHASKRQIWPITGLAGGWTRKPTTRIVRCMLVAHQLAPKPLAISKPAQKAPLLSRASERCQKPKVPLKSAPDDAPRPFGCVGRRRTPLMPNYQRLGAPFERGSSG